MAADYTMKQHDTTPALPCTLGDANGAIDLTGSTIRMLLKAATPPTLVVGVCTIVSPTEGQVKYDWQTGDTAVAATYQLEFEITFPSTKIETFPSDGYLSLVILPDLGP